MGIRISAFALDHQPFDQFLDRSVAETLFFIAERSKGDHVSFHASDWSSKERYVVLPSRNVSRWRSGSNPVALTLNVAARIPLLRQSLREYLAAYSGYGMLFLLEALVTVPEIRWVSLLTEGHKPWWIFSLLSGARDAHLPPPQLRELEELCARFLRGYQYRSPAYPLESKGRAPMPGDLAVLPVDDPDIQIGVFAPDETLRWLELTRDVAERVECFQHRVRHLEIPDAEADEGVRLMLRSFDRIESLPYRDLRMVTFIS
jgi:hypothetical protein